MPDVSSCLRLSPLPDLGSGDRKAYAFIKDLFAPAIVAAALVDVIQAVAGIFAVTVRHELSK